VNSKNCTCGCISLCTAVIHNTAQNSSDHLPCYPLDLTDWVKVLCPTQHKMVISETFPGPIFWLGMEKLNLTQQKCTITKQNKCTTTQNKHKKLKPGLVASYNIRPENREGLFWFWRFINLPLTHLLKTLTHLLTALVPTLGYHLDNHQWWDVVHWRGLHSSKHCNYVAFL